MHDTTPAGGDAGLPRIDGRHLRPIATRKKLIAATRLLMRQGIWRPPVASIAAIAGVSTRCLFDHFGDSASLYVEAIADLEIAAGIASQVLSDRNYDPAFLPEHVWHAICQRVAHAAVTGRPLPAAAPEA